MQVGWLGALAPEERGEVEGGWREAVAGRRAYEVECRLVIGGGEPHWFRLRAAPVLFGDNGIREWVWTAEDIHERKLNPLLHSATDGARQLTGAQIRAARGLLNWSVRDLSEAPGCRLPSSAGSRSSTGRRARARNAWETSRQPSSAAGSNSCFLPWANQE
ncbi:PAS domain-containing protein [Micromonospora sp. STR1s_5]|nr:PAS domain-containing protein [Micromonospora sp. STR1s_5]